jgi:hypothetical protein
MRSPSIFRTILLTPHSHAFSQRHKKGTAVNEGFSSPCQIHGSATNKINERLFHQFESLDSVTGKSTYKTPIFLTFDINNRPLFFETFKYHHPFGNNVSIMRTYEVERTKLTLLIKLH